MRELWFLHTFKVDIKLARLKIVKEISLNDVFGGNSRDEAHSFGETVRMIELFRNTFNYQPSPFRRFVRLASHYVAV